MKKLQVVSILYVVFAVIVIAGPILGATPTQGDFYGARLRAGREEARLGRHLEAVDDLQIACFGFLDEPPLLVEGLVRLALEQTAAGRSEDAAGTLARFTDVEGRFGVWWKANLEPETRAAFLRLLTAKIGAAGVKALPSLTAPPEPVETPAATAPVVPALTAAPAPASTPASTPPPTSTPPPPPARPAQQAPASAAAMLAESRRLVQEGKYVESYRVLTSAVAADPKSRDLRKALLEAAVLTKDWKTAAAQVDKVKPFGEGEENQMFYAAVALYETGSAAEAKTLAEKALPKVAANPFVEYYGKRILGTKPAVR